MLLVNNTLKVLDFSHCRLGSKLMVGITDGLYSNRTITKLLLRNNQIEDYPVEILAHILKSPVNNITHIDLSSNFITDFGGVALG